MTKPHCHHGAYWEYLQGSVKGSWFPNKVLCNYTLLDTCRLWGSPWVQHVMCCRLWSSQCKAWRSGEVKTASFLLVFWWWYHSGMGMKFSSLNRWGCLWSRAWWQIKQSATCRACQREWTFTLWHVEMLLCLTKRFPDVSDLEVICAMCSYWWYSSIKCSIRHAKCKPISWLGKFLIIWAPVWAVPLYLHLSNWFSCCECSICSFLGANLCAIAWSQMDNKNWRCEAGMLYSRPDDIFTVSDQEGQWSAASDHSIVSLTVSVCEPVE